jgi:predicted nucleic acid-binding protein
VIPVFLETNWVVEVCAPPYRRETTAVALLERAAAGELEIHVPAIALREATDVIRRKHQPRQSRTLQAFRSWANQAGHINDTEADVAKVFLDKFESYTRSALINLDQRVDEIAEAPGVHVFALCDEMLALAIALRTKVHALGPFDEAILAAVLVRAKLLREHSPIFCTLDTDLSPSNRRGQPRPEFVDLYAEAGVSVRTDFLIPR